MLYQRLNSIRFPFWHLLSAFLIFLIQFQFNSRLENSYIPAVGYLEKFNLSLDNNSILKSLLIGLIQLFSLIMAYLAFKRAILEKIQSKLYLFSFLILLFGSTIWLFNLWTSIVLFLFCSSLYQLNLFSLGNKGGIRIFNSGLLIGVSTIIIPSAASLLITVVLAMMAYNDLDLRKILLLFLGFIGPIYFLTSILYLDDKLVELGYLMDGMNLEAIMLHTETPDLRFGILIILALLAVFSVFLTLSSLGSVNVQSRRTLNFYLFNTIYFSFLFVISEIRFDLALLVCIPFLSLFIAHALTLGKRYFYLIDILFTLLILGTFYQFTF